MAVKLRRNETFYIREGWFEKAINTIKRENKNIFYKNEGILNLGIGSNMVKGLKYWLKAANVIDVNNNLTEFGELLYQYDRYLDYSFSWFLIHYFLTTNKEDCPIAYEIFNADINAFDKDSAVTYLYGRFVSEDPKVSKSYIEKDLNVFWHSYINENANVNPEDNYICPLSRLKLMKQNKEKYSKTRPSYSSLSYLIVFKNLQDIYDGQSFEIEDSMEIQNSPVRIFNLDKYMYLQYLDEMRRAGLITINRTAGLNTVYFEKTLQMNELLSEIKGDE